jgi:hypothetical protein
MFLRLVLQGAVVTPNFLLVMGSGLGLQRLTTSLLKLYSKRRHLVLFLGAAKVFVLFGG